MFKNAIIYSITALPIDALGADDALQDHQFIPCGPRQEKSIGWMPPRGEANGALLESVGGQWIAKLMIETRAVPGSAVAKKAAERCAHIEATTGRKPGKKETCEIKDDIKLELLPHAFSKESSVLVWIDPAAMTLVIDATSQAKADEVVTMLVKSIPGLSASLINTQLSPTAAMSEWLITQEPPAGFSIDRECELKACDESKATIKYGKHPLDIDEVKANVESGKLPTKLALTWGSRVSLVLTEGLQVKKLTFLDVVFEGQSQGKANGFDADVAIATGELRKLIPDLLGALGGEVVAQEAPIHLGSHVDGPDPRYDQAVNIVMKNNKDSISLVQRHLTIGYNRAARLVDDMENAGLVSRMNTSGQRTILKSGVAA